MPRGLALLLHYQVHLNSGFNDNNIALKSSCLMIRNYIEFSGLKIFVFLTSSLAETALLLSIYDFCTLEAILFLISGVTILVAKIKLQLILGEY